MKYINNKEITNIYFNKKPIIYIAYGTKIVWELIMSCFGNGMWNNNKIWSNSDCWKN